MVEHRCRFGGPSTVPVAGRASRHRHLLRRRLAESYERRTLRLRAAASGGSHGSGEGREARAVSGNAARHALSERRTGTLIHMPDLYPPKRGARRWTDSSEALPRRDWRQSALIALL